MGRLCRGLWALGGCPGSPSTSWPGAEIQMEPRDGSAWASWCSPPSSPSSSDSVPSLVALGPARPRMLLAPPRGVLPSRSLCLGEIKTRRGESQVPDTPLHPASATKMSCSSSKAAGCSLHAPHFIIFLAQAAHPTPGWDFFLHPLAEPAPPHADPCWKQQQWEVLVLSFPQPWLCCPAARAVFAPLVPNSGYLPPPLPLNL